MVVTLLDSGVFGEVTPIVEALAMVLVVFGGDWAAIWRLLAMVRRQLPAAALECQFIRVTSSYLSYFPRMLPGTKVTGNGILHRIRKVTESGVRRNTGEFRRNCIPRGLIYDFSHPWMLT